MSSRKRIKEDSTFLVYFDVDKSWYIASRSHLKYDGIVKVGVECLVQWGRRSDETDKGKVIETGTYPEISARYKQMKTKVPTASIVQDQVDDDEENIPLPPKKRKVSNKENAPNQAKKATNTVKKTQKPAAKVLRRSGAVLNDSTNIINNTSEITVSCIETHAVPSVTQLLVTSSSTVGCSNDALPVTATLETRARSVDVYSFENEEFSGQPATCLMKSYPKVPTQYPPTSSIKDKIVPSRESTSLMSTTSDTVISNTHQESRNWSFPALLTASLSPASDQDTVVPSKPIASSESTVTKETNNDCSPQLNTSNHPTEASVTKPTSSRTTCRSDSSTAGRTAFLRKQPSQTSARRQSLPVDANDSNLNLQRHVNKTPVFPLSFHKPKRQDVQEEYYGTEDPATYIISTTSGLESPSVSFRFNSSTSLEGNLGSVTTVRSTLSPQLSSYATSTPFEDSGLNGVSSASYDVSAHALCAQTISAPSRTGQNNSLSSTAISSQPSYTDTVNLNLQDASTYCGQTVLRVLSNSVSELANEVKRSFASVQSKLDVINKRILATEMDVSSIRQRIDKDQTNQMDELNVYDFESVLEDSEENYNDIPIAYRIGISELKSLANTSCSPGNFGKKLTERMFPELFGPGKERTQFNWNGTRGKKELNSVKKAVIRKYIRSIFPECRGKDSFAKVVEAINEGLRRPEEKRRNETKNYEYNNNLVVEIHEAESETLDEPDYLENASYTDSHNFDSL